MKGCGADGLGADGAHGADGDGLRATRARACVLLGVLERHVVMSVWVGWFGMGRKVHRRLEAG